MGPLYGPRSIIQVVLKEVTGQCLPSPQVCPAAADTSQSAGPSSGQRDCGQRAGRGNQRAVLRRQVLREDPPGSAAQVFEVKVDLSVYLVGQSCPVYIINLENKRYMNSLGFLFFNKIYHYMNPPYIVNHQYFSSLVKYFSNQTNTPQLLLTVAFLYQHFVYILLFRSV